MTILLAICLGLGLAAASGFRTFLPLLVTSAALHFDLFGLEVHPSMQWLGSTSAIVALGAAAIVEILADLVPLLDNLLTLVGTVTGPVAGTILAWAAFSDLDPTWAALAGLIVGAPTAFAVASAQTGTRAASTVTTGGIANPAISASETGLSLGTSLVAILAPLLVVPLLGLIAWVGWRLTRRLRTR